ncbi:MAG: hypothetical protein Q7R33_04920 [Nitrosarchaeum sp.]|nr:hypothetical protein [Nitrosarchaeum sp.]
MNWSNKTFSAYRRHMSFEDCFTACFNCKPKNEDIEFSIVLAEDNPTASATIEDQKIWGFVNLSTYELHYWYSEDCTLSQKVIFLTHELVHLHYPLPANDTEIAATAVQRLLQLAFQLVNKLV